MTATMELPTGAAGAALMTATMPCTVPWCTDCAWNFDEIGGRVSRMHYGRDSAREGEPSTGMLISVLEYPAGDPDHLEAILNEPVISLAVPDNDELTIVEAREFQSTLSKTLAKITDNPAPGSLVSAAAPAWSVDLDFECGEVQYHRYSRSPDDQVYVLLEQIDYIDVTDGVVQLIRRPATIRLEFEPFGQYETPSFVEMHSTEMVEVERFRDGWMPVVAERITPDRIAMARAGVAELLAAYDGAVQR